MSLEHSPARQAGKVGRGASCFMTQDEAAELLRLSRRTLERMRLEGTGPPFYKFGRRVLYEAASILNWADAQRRTSTSDTGDQA
jgi:excisionase family DNA binding protein